MEQYLSFLVTAFDVGPIALGTKAGSNEPKGSSESTTPLVPADLIETVEDSLAISPEKESLEPEKTVPLNAVPVDVAGAPRWNAPIQTDSLLVPPTHGELKRLLEEKEAQAIRQTKETATAKSRQQLLKERERERQERIRQRDRALKERQREREALLKQRERERQQRVKSR
jgi:septin family protein